MVTTAGELCHFGVIQRRDSVMLDSNAVAPLWVVVVMNAK